MSVRAVLRTLPLVSLLAVVAACSGQDEVPTQAVQFGYGMLDMSIGDVWQLESASDEARVYVHRDYEELRLELEGITEEFGHPLRVTDVKSIIGKELNGIHGNVSTRVSLAGNAMIKYHRDVIDEYDDAIHTEDWVLAKPTGQGDITRIEISLRIPEDLRTNPKIPALIEQLDRQAGDARIPRV